MKKPRCKTAPEKSFYEIQKKEKIGSCYVAEVSIDEIAKKNPRAGAERQDFLSRKMGSSARKKKYLT